VADQQHVVEAERGDDVPQVRRVPADPMTEAWSLRAAVLTPVDSHDAMALAQQRDLGRPTARGPAVAGEQDYRRSLSLVGDVEPDTVAGAHHYRALVAALT
jgi:hypothetical protein